MEEYELLDVEVLVLKALDDRLEEGRQIFAQGHLRYDLLQTEPLVIEVTRVESSLQL